eukprot:CAMPEP_0172552076 /NCGR_PEP_ID=MMETSP1067-20121228/43617_1 /TAXON_ID=265564 ORGANISM="Thalassiosira punctigera, Strain Tpunct2005C2" /NCGR_SAMPLE_ID=MMETSP1067 /ASSEMBLY_ACC=CAM_ASM_000444 /LENGTH=71 /DNA_ID=CAMNT_0013339993 /DNA_START=119 /DNA_END=330 /DNA_ORIENTATION=-
MNRKSSQRHVAPRLCLLLLLLLSLTRPASAIGGPLQHFRNWIGRRSAVERENRAERSSRQIASSPPGGNGG